MNNPIIDQAAARAFTEVLTNDKVFGNTIQITFDTLRLHPAANIAAIALLDTMKANNPVLDKEEYENTFFAALAIAFTAGSFYAMEANAKELQRQEDIN